MADGEGSGGFLPPQAEGREPDLGAQTPPPPPPSPPLVAAQQPASGWQQPQPQWQQGWQQPTWNQQGAWGPPDPGNGVAIAALICSISAFALLLFTAGLSSIFSIGLGIAGIVCGRKGAKRVEQGATRQHKDIATAGFWIGIVSTFFSVLATLVWGLIIGLAIAGDLEEGSSGGFDDDFGEPSVLLLGAAVRTAGFLLS